MENRKIRRDFNKGNKYEEKIVLLAFTPAWIILLSLVVFLLIVRREVIKSVLYGQHVDYAAAFLSLIFHTYNYIIVGLCAIFIITVLYAFKLGRDLVGAFSRIIPEMDAVLEGRSKKTIKARPNDEFANELLKRINVLIQFYVDNKK